jgi:hypothetical protein
MMRTGVGAAGVARRLRVFALAVALLQIGLQGFFAVSDGYEERASAHVAPVHTEIPGNTHHRLHSGDCVVCHVLAASADVPRGHTPSWRGDPDVFALPAEPCYAHCCAAVAGSRLARAPPVTV